MAARWILVLAMAASCTRSTAPKARLAGEIMALAGVAGIIVSAATVSVWSGAKTSVVGCAIGMGAGMGLYTVGELTDPAGDETEAERDHRWAKILADQARDAAHDHRCADVLQLEPRVRGYDPAVHDDELMRDPAVAACFTAPAALASPPAAPGSR